MAKPAFDPSKPFERGAKPAFDPSQPFEAGEAAPEEGIVQKGLRVVAKAADTLGGPARAALAMGEGAITGKKLYSTQELYDAINPTTTRRFPDSAELLKRAGVPKGAQLSDVVPSLYAKPGSMHPAWQPEVGGAADPSVRGVAGFAGDIATDPLSWLSMGGAGAAKEIAGQSASKIALEQAAREAAGPIGRAANAVGDVAAPVGELLSMPGQVAAKLPGGAAATAVAQAPSALLSQVGKKLYKSVIRPVEHQGERFGKQAVSDTFYDAGIKSPFGIPSKAAEATDTVMNARDALLQKAGEAGGVSSMEAATNTARQKIAEIRASGDPEAARIADAMEGRLNEYVALEKETPAIPATPAGPSSTSQVATGLLDESGKPISREVTIPGTPAQPGAPAIPGKAVTPAESSAYKTSLYDSLPQGAFAEASRTNLGARLKKALANGMKQETEAATGRALGPKAAEDLTDLNDAAGKLLATRRAQESVALKAGKEADKLHHLGLSDMVMGGVGAGVNKEHSASGLLMGLLANKVRQGAQLLTMPTGYGLRKLGEGQFTGPAVDSLTRQAIKKNPWVLPPQEKPNE